MAFGVKEAVLEEALQNKIIISGINWDHDDSQDLLSLSYGGHEILGAKSLVMLRDIDDNLLLKTEGIKSLISLSQSSIFINLVLLDGLGKKNCNSMTSHILVYRLKKHYLLVLRS